MAALFIPEFARSLAAEAVYAVLIFSVLLSLGRIMKRRYGVRFGVLYRLFCVVAALYLPTLVSPNQFDWLPTVSRHLGALALLLGAFCFLSMFRRFFWEGWFERTQRTTAPKFLSELISLIIILVALLVVLGGIYGQSIQGAIFGSTVVLGILGFAMQDLLGNIIAGVALELGKPFRIGDWLVVDTQRAEVIEVNWRSTRLRTNDDTYLDIPNKTIVGTTITNLTYPTRAHAIRLHVGFDYGTPPNVIKDAMILAMTEVKGVLSTPKAKVFLKDFADSAVVYELKFFIEEEARFNDICDAVRTNVWYAAQRANLRIPFPIRTLHVERPAPKRESAMSAAEQAARRHPFLQGLDEPQMARLLMRARLQRYGRGERVILQGDGGQSMFMLLQGKADVFVGTNGSETHVATLREGDYCGEMSLLTGEPRSATVIAQTDCEMWELDKETMAELLQENEALVQKLGELLAERRLVTEGVVASSSNQHDVLTRQQEYTAGFLKKLYSFFDL